MEGIFERQKRGTVRSSMTGPAAKQLRVEYERDGF
jgi:hypothetical protein